jgi:acetyl esterase/lipase
MTAFGLGGDMLLDHWVAPRPPTSIAKLVDLNLVPELLADKSVVSDDFLEGESMRKSRFALTVRWEIDGTMLDYLFGRPGLGAKLKAVPYDQREAAVPEDLKAAFVQSFVTKGYPPSIFVHGTADEVVLHQESVHQNEQLKALGVKTELLLVEGAGHGLVDFSSGFPPKPAPGAAEAYSRSFDFIVEAFNAVL